jgi:hypothetical protein
MRPFPRAVALYAPDGHPPGPGETLKNPELAESLRRVMREGPRRLLSGADARRAARNFQFEPGHTRPTVAHPRVPRQSESRGFIAFSLAGGIFAYRDHPIVEQQDSLVFPEYRDAMV